MGKPRSNTQEFITKAQKFHQFKYNYSKVNYINQLTDVIIICSIHGEFIQTPKKHLKWGCNKCAQIIRNNSRRSSQEEVINKANLVHNYKYDYINVNYINDRIKVEIICSKHGIFMQNMHDHLSGRGCPKCCSKVSKGETLWLDQFSISSDYRYYRLIINDRTFYVDGFDPITNTVYEFNGDYWHGNPKIFNLEDLNSSTRCTFKELYYRTLEKEQILKNAGYKVVSIWESEFKKSLLCEQLPKKF